MFSICSWRKSTSCSTSPDSSGTTYCAYAIRVLGSTVTITAGAQIFAGDSVTVVISNATNGPSAPSLTAVSTSSDSHP